MLDKIVRMDGLCFIYEKTIGWTVETELCTAMLHTDDTMTLETESGKTRKYRAIEDEYGPDIVREYTPPGAGEPCNHCGKPIWGIGGDGVQVCYGCGWGTVL